MSQPRTRATDAARAAQVRRSLGTLRSALEEVQGSLTVLETELLAAHASYAPRGVDGPRR